MHTTAVVIPQANTVELRAVELTAPGVDDVVVQTAYTSISAGTERMLLAGRMPHPMLQFPLVPGYETVGRVVATGANVPTQLNQQWVYIAGARCYADVNPAWGGQAATLHVDYRRVVPLDGVEPEQGVLLALAATALHGVDLLELKPNGRVLVIGQGPVGQLAARIARGRGSYVAVADRQLSRLERAQADHKIDVTVGTIADAGSEPFDAIIEASGSMQALADALPLLRERGAILLLGYYDELRLPYMPLFLKQARLLAAREWGPGDLLECRDMLADGTLDVRTLLTHRMPIAQVAQAYETALHDPECLKLVLDWSFEL